MNGFGWGAWLLGGLMMLVFWGGIIALVFFSIRAFSGSGNCNTAHSTNSSETALDILKQRYARGELSKEEFETIREDLKI
ncbi:MAG: SHOCT domain-containing protein [Ardenticatenaceae bacterium]|nr:SHOCT domain-containing protein [Ardenticatenaceae bacterium]